MVMLSIAFFRYFHSYYSLSTTRFPARLLLMVLASVAAVNVASAELAVDDHPAMDKDGSEIVITGPQVAPWRQSPLTSTTVIDRQQIEQWQSRSLTDVLQRLPGFSFANNGGVGQNTAVFLRGTEADHVLVLIDGVAVGSVSTGTMAFQDLPLNQIERIEVIRGPASALYGADAVGGVIQIFTLAPSGAQLQLSAKQTSAKQPSAKQPSAKLAVGSHHSVEAAISHQAGFHVTDHVSGQMNVGVAKTQTQGFNSCRFNIFNGCGVDAPDDDGYSNHSGNVNLRLQTLSGQSFSVSALQANAHTEFDSYAPDSVRNMQRVLSGELTTPLSNRQQLILTSGQSTDRSKNFVGDVAVNGGFFKTRRDSIGLLHQWQLSHHQSLSAGVDYRYDHLDADINFIKTDRRTLGGVFQYHQQWQQYSAQLAGRYDDNSQFGDYSTGNLRVGYQSNPQTQWYASIGDAFKAPSFNDLYYPGFSNPDLQPEQSVSYELGMDYNGPVQLRTALFQTDIDQLITYNAALNKPVNVSQARIIGQEFGAQWMMGPHWQLSGQLTLLDTQNRSKGSLYGKALSRRPMQSLSLDVERKWQVWSAAMQVTAHSHRYDDLNNTAKLGGYSLLNLRIAQQISSAWLLQASVDNIADKTYETVEYYHQPGRTFWFTVRYQDS